MFSRLFEYNSNEYLYLFISILISTFISIILLSICWYFAYKEYKLEKVSSYECGFHPFEDTRDTFKIRFYLVSILFIIFDLEIVFLFPWCLYLYFLGLFGYWIMFIFLAILTIGFIYEWLKGALDWE